MNDLVSETPQATTRLERQVPSFGLKTALSIVIAVAFLIVVAGYLIYINDDNYKYDIARPGDRNNAQAVTIDETAVNDTTSVVDPNTLQEHLEFLDKEIAALKATNNFDGRAVTNQSLQLSTESSPSL